MKKTTLIAFWSNFGQSGVSSNTVGISIALSLLSEYSSVILANHYDNHFLGHALLGREYDRFLKEESNYFVNGDTTNFYKNTMHRMNKSVQGNCAVEIIDDGLYYIPQSRIYADDVFELEFQKNMNETFKKMNSMFDCTFIDTKSQQNISTKDILDCSDIVVVCLRQEWKIISDFFKKYMSILHKCVFIISAYHRNAPAIRKRIEKEYDIPSELISVVPFNFYFNAAMKDGTVRDFIAENMKCKRTDTNYYFMRNLKNTTEMLSEKIKNVQNQAERKKYEKTYNNS